MSTPNTHIGYLKIGEIMSCAKDKDIFFLGAGGIMMSSLALLTKKSGFCVRGSDRCRSSLTQKLENSGVNMFYGHSAENLGDNTGVVVYTVAVSPDNPEYCEALSKGIPLISRADYLGYIMTEYKNRVGIAGMHGKSTCTSMCAQIFLDSAQSGRSSEPTIVSGAEYASMDGAYYIGERDNFVFEACEYMDSFLDFNPTVAVLLNAEMEHVDYFKSIDQICESFSRYASLVGQEGTVVYNADDDNIVRSVGAVNAKKISFGLVENADLTATNIQSCEYPMQFDIILHGELFAHVSLPSHGIHNVYNALAACAAAYSCGIDAEDIARGLGNFKGAKRRMEYKGELCGATVYDDYGHHPTEIGATLRGVKDACDRRLICVFQPHTYSRTAALADKFAEAFEAADKVIFADIYAAREINESGITSKKLAEMIGDKATYGGSFDDIAELLRKTVEQDDLVIIMGAGDIFKLFEKIGL